MKRIITFLFAAIMFAMFAQPVSSQSVTSDEIQGGTTGIAIGTNSQKAPFTGTYYSGSKSGMLYDNGSLVNIPGGVGAPDTSRLQSALNMTTLGAGAQKTATVDNRVADNLVITDSAWVIDSIIVYFYQTGSSTTSTMTAVNLQVWNGDPSLPASAVHWGNTTANVLGQSYWSWIYRDSESSPGDLTRPVMACNLATPGLILAPGTWWIDYQGSGSLSSGPWAPPITITGNATTGDAKQKTSSGWAALVDGGSTTPQGLPFLVYGYKTANTGIDRVPLSDNTKLWPNPATGSLSIESADVISRVEFYNGLGQLVLNNLPETAQTTIDISSLTSGVYIVSVQTGNRIVKQKLIVK